MTSQDARRLGVARYFDGSRLRDGDVAIAGGVITAVGLMPAGSGIAAPGWLDLQVNGFAGVDVLHATEADLRGLAGDVVATGVTGLLAAVITADGARAESAVRAIGRARSEPRPGSARILGAHLEGPFLSPAHPGAHPRELLRRDARSLRILAGSDAVTMITLAPEVLDDDRAIADVVAAGKVVGIGHSDATAAQCARAFEYGATALTHAFNAHKPMRSRDPGPLGGALARPDIVLTVITDGVHVAPENLIVLDRAAHGRLALVTDGIVAAGLGDGSYRFGSLDVEVSDGRATLADGTLAGSVATMDRCVRHAASLWGVEAALAAASSTPAALIHRPDLGRIAVGCPAEVVRLDDDLTVLETIVAGVTAWRRRDDGDARRR